MKKLILCASACVMTGLFTGCVPQTYQKTVTTTLDGSGKPTGTVIVETITEPHSATPRIQAPASGGVPLNNISK
jgi:hypothetical protein